MAKTTVEDTVIIIDDELHNVGWMAEYLYSRGKLVLFATNVNEAVELVDSEIYRALIVDLNIPALEPLDAAVNEQGLLYTRFPGLFVARRARNRGYRDRQVIIYSVHKDASVSIEAQRLGCTYIIKGRPREIKAELESVLEFDPTSD